MDNLSNKLNVLEKVAAARRIMNPEYSSSIDDLVSIIFYNEDQFAIANNSFMFGYYQGIMAERDRVSGGAFNG